jgi:uncharacterized protein (TIGR02452 family)
MISKQDKIQIAKSTLDILDKGFYINSLGQSISIADTLNKAKQTSQYLGDEHFITLFAERNSLLIKRPQIKTLFEVNNETTLTACERLSKQENRVFCLNFASAKNAGGGFLGGAQAQEETLARTSGLYPCLLKYQDEFYLYHKTITDYYYSDKMIYSADVPVFKNDDGNLLEHYYKISFLTSPAVNIGALQQKNQLNQQKADHIMLHRIEKLLSLAFIKGYQTLVLGAWGCGVFQNTPNKVAHYFAHFLTNGGLFENRFQHIVFAVLSQKEGNIVPFLSLFVNR